MDTTARSLAAALLALLALAHAGCDGCFDCRQCPSICAAGSACVEAYLMSEDRKAWVCRELPGRPKLTAGDAGVCDAAGDRGAGGASCR